MRPVDRDGGGEAAPGLSRPEERTAKGDRRAFPVAAATGLGAGIALVMGGALVHGAMDGNLFEEGEILLALAWGRVAMIDAYAGIALFAAWICHREQRGWIAGVWIVAMCLLGNVVAGCYVALAASGCRGSASRFWLGPHRAGSETG